MSVSNYTNTFANLTADDFYREAFERIGIRGVTITSELINSAEMSANMALTSWLGKGPNGWTIKRNVIELVAGQGAYRLPRNVTQVINVLGSKPTLCDMKGGITVVTDPVDYFDGNPADLFDYSLSSVTPVAWYPKAADSFIAYKFSSRTVVNYVGIQVAQTPGISFVFSAPSGDPVYETEEVDLSGSRINWFSIPAPKVAGEFCLSLPGSFFSLKRPEFKFRKIILMNNGNGQSLNNDRMLGAISYSDWMALPNKYTQNMPTSYFVDTQLEPILNIWPVPSTQSLNTFTHLFYNAYQYPYSVNNLFSSFNVPQKFFDAITADLAYRLACKWKSEDINGLQRLQNDSNVAFALAAQTDSQNYSLNINPDFSGFRA